MSTSHSHQFGFRLTGRWLPLLACLIGGLAASFADTDRAAEEIITFSQFQALPPEQAIKGKQVKYQGIVVCHDLEWGQLYIHDGRQSDWFNPREFSTQPKVGEFVEIKGTTTVVEGANALTNLSLVVIRGATLPAAKRLALTQLNGDLGQWVEVSGRVDAVDTSWGRPVLKIRDKGESCKVFVMGTAGANDLHKFPGTVITARGINSTKLIAGGFDATLFAPGISQITVIKPADVNSALPEVSSISSLLDRELGDWTNQPVRINGLVISCHPGQSITVKDPTGFLHAEVSQITQARADERVDVRGYLKLTAQGPILSDAWFEIVQPVVPNAPSIVPPGSTNAESRVITRASEILKLRPEEAGGLLPVRLHGVITFADTEWGTAFLQDQSGGVFVELKQDNVRAGQWVELIGQTGPGGFAPEIMHPAIQVLGLTNLPPSARVDLADLANGQLDAQWVEMEGVIRSVTLDGKHLHLCIMSQQGKFNALVPDFTQSLPTQLIDAQVRIRGACGSDLNLKHQLIGITLHVPALDQITILEPAPADPFAVTATQIAEVAKFDPDRLAGRRVRVSGVVTLRIPDQGFFVQDTSGGISIQTQETNAFAVGDSVDVLGFPTLGDFSPGLEETTFRVSGKGRLPVAQKATAEQILFHGTNDGQLVCIEARLLQSVRRAASPQLVMQSGSIIFNARVAAPATGLGLPALAAGSVVRLTGVCSIHGDKGEPESFRLLLRSPADVVLVSAPPLWTARQILWVLAGLGFVFLISLAWVRALRRQVKWQTRKLRDEITERERMELQIQETHKELLVTSRKAGMAEVATGILHNVGNVLNSVNISSSCVADRLRNSKASNLSKVVGMLQEHEADLGAYLTNDTKGKAIPGYLAQLAGHLAGEQAETLKELAGLQKNIEHIKDIVAMQQSYATVSGVSETVKITDLIEDALGMNISALTRHDIQLRREYALHLPEVNVEKHKVLQILVNLIRNAKHACEDSASVDKRLVVRVTNGSDRVRVSVVDNGVGIPAENLTRIFNHGFTTKKDGHGFGLHSGALAARQMGGTLTVHSDGPGKGAAFTLELPVTSAVLPAS